MQDPSLCDVVLDSNVFESNRARNKGGALRYVNKNFTTVFREELVGGVPVAVDSNSYVNNSAAYADNIASYPMDYVYFLSQED